MEPVIGDTQQGGCLLSLKEEKRLTRVRWTKRERWKIRGR